MGVYGPSYGEGRGFSNGIINSGQPQNVVLEIPIVHNDLANETAWHVQAELTAVNDPPFAAPIIQTDTLENRLNWWYRLEQGEDRELHYYPSIGTPTSKADGVVATAIYFLSQEETSNLTTNNTYLLRYRITADDGVNWSNWVVVLFST